MCGRYTLTSFDNLAFEFGLKGPVSVAAPRFNIAPTQTAPIIVNRTHDEGRRLHLARWGLVPSWAKDPSIGNRMINARCESAARRPAFREPLQKRRCIVVADGFYEWKPTEPRPGSKRKPRKIPYYIHRRSQAPFAMAGLWERWRPVSASVPMSAEDDAGGHGAVNTADNDWLESFAILTCDANELMAPLHTRMPVILDRADYDRWLHPEPLPPDALRDLLVTPPVGDFEAFTVSTVVNKPVNDTPLCVEPFEPEADPDPAEDPQGSLFDFFNIPQQ